MFFAFVYVNQKLEKIYFIFLQSNRTLNSILMMKNKTAKRISDFCSIWIEQRDNQRIINTCICIEEKSS